MAYEIENDDAGIALGPLIDCVFLLLIFFLVSTMTKKQNRDVSEIVLPQSRSAESHAPNDNQGVIAISKKGDLYYNGQACSIMFLHHKIRELAQADNKKQIRIDADAEVPLHHVVKVLDLCEFNQLTHLVLRSYDESH